MCRCAKTKDANSVSLATVNESMNVNVKQSVHSSLNANQMNINAAYKKVNLSSKLTHTADALNEQH